MSRRAWGAAAGVCLAVGGCSSGGSGDGQTTSGVDTGPARTSSAAGTATALASGARSAAPAEMPVCSLKVKSLDFVVWSPSGQHLLTGGPTTIESTDGKTIEDGSVDAWDLAKGERVLTFHLGAQKTRRVVYLGFTKDGSSAVASGSAHDQSWPIARWDLATGATTFASAWIRYPEGIDVSHDGKLAIVDGGGSNAVLVQLPGLKVLHQTVNDTSASGSMVFSKDDASIVSDWQTGMSLDAPRTLKTKKSWTANGVVSPDRASVALAGKDLWGVVDASSGKKIVEFEGHPTLPDGAFVTLSYSPDGKRVAASTGDQSITVWSAETGKKLGTGSYERSTSGMRPWAWTRDASVLIVNAWAFDAATMKRTSDADLPDGALVPIAGHDVAVLEGDSLKEFNASTGEPTGRSWKVPGGAEFETERVMSPDGARIAYARMDSWTVRIVRLSDGATVDLGVVWVGGAQRGYAVSADGAFDGPAEAAACAAKVIGKTTTPSPGLLRDFMTATKR